MRAGNWLREDGMQLTGKTLGLIGFGGIAAEVARIAIGSGMRVLAWNRTPRSFAGVSFLSLEKLLAESDVVSLHLLLNDDTRGFLSRQRIAAMKQGAILVNTARGALVDEAAMIEALKSGRLRHAGLDVFNTEPLPIDHPLIKLPNVTLSAHSAFRTPEASENLIGAAWEHCRRIVGTSLRA
jgi:D-3-phosphoglycerate dehydrogenase / 2-oxoglutarate reductase